MFCIYLSIPQVLVHDSTPETELIWMTSPAGQVPYEAVVAGHRANGDPLYVAKHHEWVGNYDIIKDCVDYNVYDSDYMCRSPYTILTLLYSELSAFDLNLRAYKMATVMPPCAFGMMPLKNHQLQIIEITDGS